MSQTTSTSNKYATHSLPGEWGPITGKIFWPQAMQISVSVWRTVNIWLIRLIKVQHHNVYAIKNKSPGQIKIRGHNKLLKI